MMDVTLIWFIQPHLHRDTVNNNGYVFSYTGDSSLQWLSWQVFILSLMSVGLMCSGLYNNTSAYQCI